MGRGCLAGPVVVAALALPKNFKINKKLLSLKFPELRDSKKLTFLQREIWFQFIKKSALCYSISLVSPKIIDKINISNAANLAATRVFFKLTAGQNDLANRAKIYLDGGLYLNKKSLLASGYILNPQTIIKGDEKIPAISLASIVAKVYRDRLMKRLHKKYPQYDFINNVGYGTKKHIKAIKKFGYSKIHRKSFKIK